MILGGSFSGQPSDQYGKQPWGPNFFLVLLPRVGGSLIFLWISPWDLFFVLCGWCPRPKSCESLFQMATGESYKINAPWPFILRPAPETEDTDCPCDLFLEHLDLPTKKGGSWGSCSVYMLPRVGLPFQRQESLIIPFLNSTLDPLWPKGE